MTIEAGKTYIRTLRATSNERDTLAFRLRVDQMLSAADLYPRGLSDSAIVCIRSFHALLPPAQQVHYGGGRLPTRWEAHVRASLKQIIQQAAHPLHGNASSSSEAVIFADRAEMLASLAIDWRTGIYTQRWWWRSLFRGANIGSILLPIWLETPEYIPAALSHLAAKREAVPFVHRLSPHEARSLLQSITRTFALRELQSVLSTLPTRSTTPASEAFHQPSKDSLHIQPSTPPSQAPWRQWVPESTDGNLPLEHQALLGIGLMLLRVPSIVRSTSFAQAVYLWHTHTQTYTHTATQFSATKHADSVGEPHPGDDEGSLSVREQGKPHPGNGDSTRLVREQKEAHLGDGDGTLSVQEQRESQPGDDENRTEDEKGQFVAPNWEASVPATVPADKVPTDSIPLAGTLSAGTVAAGTQATDTAGASSSEAQAVNQLSATHMNIQQLESAQPFLSSEQTQTEKRQNVRFQAIESPGEEAFATQKEHVQGEEEKQDAQSVRQKISFFTETSLPVDVDALTTTTNDTTTDITADITNALPSQKANESGNSPSLPEKQNPVGARLALARPDQAPERGRARASLAPTEFPHKDDVTDNVVETITSTPVSVNEGDNSPNNVIEASIPTAAKGLEQSLSMPTTMIDILSPHAYDKRIETVYGGLFYLINLGLFLDLYGDFTTPLQAGIDLPIWDFMALLGEQMLGENIYADPIWSLLAQLAGRATWSTETTDGNDSTEAIHTTNNDQEPPGLYFEPPEQWRVPAQWLSAFPETEGWQWSKEDGRLRVKHPAQFLLLDLPLMNNVEPVEQLKHELQPYADFFEGNMPELDYVPPGLRPDESLLPCGQPVVRELARALSPALQQWLCWLMPYIYARLQRALGMEEDENPPAVLCRHQAFISVSAAHLRIDLALAELPIAIRIAGLDRDPGWVPAAGRFIAFHFQ